MTHEDLGKSEGVPTEGGGGEFNLSQHNFAQAQRQVYIRCEATTDDEHGFQGKSTYTPGKQKKCECENAL